MSNMEELTASIATSFQVSQEPNSTAAQHPRFSEYKLKGNKKTQQDRRKLYLELQKQHRYDYNALARNLAQGSWKNDAIDDDEDHSEGMEVDVKLKRPGRYYKNQLMFSEWLVEVPHDFETDWTMVICPVGKRCLVVASNGSTSAFGKNGYRLHTFPSLLPGGNKYNRQKKGECTILDCVLDTATQTFLILDMMYWKSHPFYDSETEFRFYWLQTKFSEDPEIGVVSKLNKFKFLPLPCFPCKKDVISSALDACNFCIDGLLFYHKKTHYNFGSTPLVVWLKPYMLPEILDIHEPAHLLIQTPKGYTNYATHLAEEKTKQPYGPNYNKKVKTKSKSKKDKMEVGQIESPDTSQDISLDSSQNDSVIGQDGSGDTFAVTMETQKVDSTNEEQTDGSGDTSAGTMETQKVDSTNEEQTDGSGDTSAGTMETQKVDSTNKEQTLTEAGNPP